MIHLPGLHPPWGPKAYPPAVSLFESPTFHNRSPPHVSEESRVARESTGYHSMRRKDEGWRRGNLFPPGPHQSMVPEVCLVSVVWLRARQTLVPPTSSGPGRREFSWTHVSPGCGWAAYYLGFSLPPHTPSFLPHPLTGNYSLRT